MNHALAVSALIGSILDNDHGACLKGSVGSPNEGMSRVVGSPNEGMSRAVNSPSKGRS